MEQAEDGDQAAGPGLKKISRWVLGGGGRGEREKKKREGEKNDELTCLFVDFFFSIRVFCLC